MCSEPIASSCETKRAEECQEYLVEVSQVLALKVCLKYHGSEHEPVLSTKELL